MARVLRFSRHFVQRWAERMGGLPDIETVNAMMAASLLIIKQKVLYERPPTGPLIKHEALSHYWNDPAGMILLIDDNHGIAVTILTPDMKDKYRTED